ncbi:MAG: DNA primase, partial [Bradyrhizobium sp.]|nr:DNA primase [Bradyrhizobium sp.]
MPRDASELAHRLAREAEAVCRHYLSNGKRQGRYWLVGDVQNTPGRSLFVRLYESPKGPAGKWTDAATGEHGDLLDIIRERCGFGNFREVAEEARRFLKLPRPNQDVTPKVALPAVQRGSREAARRLFAISQPIESTLVQLYLRRRGIDDVHHGGSLRYQPRCYYHPPNQDAPEIWPAMIARVTDLDGTITGVHRTWLDPEGFEPHRLG